MLTSILSIPRFGATPLENTICICKLSILRFPPVVYVWWIRKIMHEGTLNSAIPHSTYVWLVKKKCDGKKIKSEKNKELRRKWRISLPELCHVAMCILKHSRIHDYHKRTKCRDQSSVENPHLWTSILLIPRYDTPLKEAGHAQSLS